MTRPRPRIVQITNAAHKKLKVMAAEEGRTMGEIVEGLIDTLSKRTTSDEKEDG